MKRNYADENADAYARLDGSLSEIEPDDMSQAVEESRLALIADYRHEALRKVDCLQANLALVNCGLLDLALQSETVMKKLLQSDGANILESPEMQRIMRNHLQITRQIDRYANLDARIDENKHQAESARARCGTAGRPAPVGATYRSNHA
jgi:hypothetical protein